MRSEITKNKEFYIISRNIDNAEKCIIIDTNKDCFVVKLKNKRKYEVDEAVELFTITDLGQLYFETIVKEVQEDILYLWYPISSKYLQRREFVRIYTQETVTLSDEKNEITAKISDISGGGLKLVTNTPLELLKNYNIKLNIENKEINTKFQPIRIEYLNNAFISSGKFNDINNYDKIILIQYCFRKQIQNNGMN